MFSFLLLAVGIFLLRLWLKWDSYQTNTNMTVVKKEDKWWKNQTSSYYATAWMKTSAAVGITGYNTKLDVYRRFSSTHAASITVFSFFVSFFILIFMLHGSIYLFYIDSGCECVCAHLHCGILTCCWCIGIYDWTHHYSRGRLKHARQYFERLLVCPFASRVWCLMFDAWIWMFSYWLTIEVLGFVVSGS